MGQRRGRGAGFKILYLFLIIISVLFLLISFPLSLSTFSFANFLSFHSIFLRYATDNILLMPSLSPAASLFIFCLDKSN